jgi:biotin carboxylase
VTHLQNTPAPDKPTILLLTTGFALYREYLLRSAAEHANIWLFHDVEPGWEKPFLIGNTVISSQDTAAMVKAARSLPAGVQIAGVLCWNETRIIQTAELAQALGVPGTTPENIKRCRDKYLTRQALAAQKVPQPASILAGSVDQALETARRIGYPVIVKPRDMGGSFGVSLAQDEKELAAAVAHALMPRKEYYPERGPGVLIEEFADGPEVSIDAAWVQGKMFPLYLARKLTGFYPHFEEVGHVVDANDPLLEDAVFLNVLEGAHRAVGFQTGITHTELRLTPAGPKIIEINGRLGGDMIPYVGWVASGINPGQVAVEVTCGRVPSVAPPQKRIAAIRFFYPPYDAVVGQVRIDTSALPASVEKAAALVSPGQKLILPPADHIFGRYGYVVVHAETMQACEAALTQAERAFTLEASPL